MATVEPFVGIEVAAQHLNVKKSWLYGRIISKKDPVPSYKIGAFRRFKLSEVEDWARGRGSGNGGSHGNLVGS